MEWIDVNLPWKNPKNPDFLPHPGACAPAVEIAAWQAEVAHACAENDAGCFTGRGLAQPGTLIEMADGSRFLIGDINQKGGDCDDCLAFLYDEIVARYKVVVKPEDLR